MDEENASADRAEQGPERIDTVLRYHQQSKHHFFRYAQGPDHLDWANQPDPFRRFTGAALIALPRLHAGDAPASPPYGGLAQERPARS